MMKTPIITKELVDYLERLYPLEPPTAKESLQEVYYKAGQTSTVRFLRKQYEKQLAEMN